MVMPGYSCDSCRICCRVFSALMQSLGGDADIVCGQSHVEIGRGSEKQGAEI